MYKRATRMPSETNQSEPPQTGGELTLNDLIGFLIVLCWGALLFHKFSSKKEKLTEILESEDGQAELKAIFQRVKTLQENFPKPKPLPHYAGMKKVNAQCKWLTLWQL